MSEISVAEEVNGLLAGAGLAPIDAGLDGSFEAYFERLVHWNARTNLTAVRDRASILSRHFLESIATAQLLPSGIATLLDYGSGAGFPGIPIALCRPEIAVTLAESQGKKASFLREVKRTLKVPLSIYSQRAETISTRFDCVILRAVDKMPQAVENALCLIAPGGWLALMTTESELGQLKSRIYKGQVEIQMNALPGSERRVLGLVRLSVGGLT